MAKTDELSEAIEAGWTIPAEWYCDEEIFKDEQRTIFEESWQFVGRLEQLATPGDFITAVIGRTPVVVVRNRREQLAGFVNVCRHRCSEVVQGTGHRNVLQCHYHAWTYDLDGKLISAPDLTGRTTSTSRSCASSRCRWAVSGPFVFAYVSPDPLPLSDELGELPSLMKRDGLDFDELSFSQHGVWEVEANWKIVVENYGECYHCPVAHPSFSRLMEVDPESYFFEAGTHWSWATTSLRSWREGSMPQLAYDLSGP